ncbi:hypothetical protein NP493_1948g00004 [Ridgeia piscesae]|uniref:Uncharacterized protein n=1 Tax=Ridgeia piscesae TaxID=27915 RepID=A0AAD9JPA9_RIDPI|nr:hypothetical protein NP493_1948g00004 [Ridgeia piscesae]
MLTNSGCDELVTVGVLYKRQTFNDDQWLYKAAQQVTSTHLAITELAFDVYEVKVTATNNEDITSMSSTVVANLMTDSGRMSTERTVPVVSCLKTGPVVGITVTTFILGCVVTAVILPSIIR